MAVGVNWRALVPASLGCCSQGGEEGEEEEGELAWGDGELGEELTALRLVQYLGARQQEVSMEQFEELLDSLEVFLRSLIEG